MPTNAAHTSTPAAAGADQPTPTVRVLGVDVDAAIFRSAVRWTLNIIALAVLGPLAATLASGLDDRHGGDAVSLLVNESPMLGLLALLATGAIAVTASGIAARVSQPPMGLTVAGLTAAWVALSLGDSGEVLRAGGAGTIGALALEAVLALAIGVCVLHAARSAEKPADGVAHGEATPPLASPVWYVKSLLSAGAAFGVAAGAAGALFGAWLVARDDLRAQSMMAAVVGAIVGGAVARLAGTLLPGGDPALAHRADIPAIGVLVAGVLAPLSLFVIPGLGDVDAAARAATFAGPGSVLPVDWLVGAMLGTPIGINWAGSLLGREEPKG